MLQIKIDEKEYFDEFKMEFIKVEECTLNLEHSLVSLTKWEEKYRKPFLDPTCDHRPLSESIDYIKCMTINDVDPMVYMGLTNDDIGKIFKYINDTPTATTFSNIERPKASNEVLTAEVIYYMMISNQIPLDWENRNLNKLLTLLKVFGEKNKPPKKMSKGEINKQNRSLNKARKAKRR